MPIKFPQGADSRSILQVTRANADGESIGVASVLNVNAHHVYVVTCLHILLSDSLDIPDVMVDGAPCKMIAQGDEKFDVAVLRFDRRSEDDGLVPLELHRPVALDFGGDGVHEDIEKAQLLCYSSSGGEKVQDVGLRGAERIFFKPSKQHVSMWTISAKKMKKIEKGMSGSPILKNGQLIALVTHTSPSQVADSESEYPDCGKAISLQKLSLLKMYGTFMPVSHDTAGCFFVVMDIDNSSDLSDANQRDAVALINSFIPEVTRDLKSVKHITIGDRTLLVFEQDGKYKQVLEMAELWMSLVHESVGDDFAVHLGVHVGVCSISHFHSTGDTSVVGSEVNKALHIASSGAPWKILVSEDFVASFCAKSAKRYEQFTPSDPRVRAGLPSSGKDSPARFRCRELNTQLIGAPKKNQTRTKTNSGFPEVHDLQAKYQQNVQATDEQIMAKLVEIYDLFGQEVDGFCAVESERLRVSIFVSGFHATTFAGESKSSGRRAKPKLYLTPTIYRYPDLGRGKSVTKYRLHPPEGPLAKSFCDNEIHYVKDLPNYGKNPQKYIDKLNALGIRTPTTTNFSRKARSFLAVPMGSIDESTGFRIVICIDCMHPLSQFSRKNARSIGMRVQQSYGDILVSLIRRRFDDKY